MILSTLGVQGEDLRGSGLRASEVGIAVANTDGLLGLVWGGFAPSF